MAPEERAQLLRETPPNTWIALASDESKVVGHGASYEEAVTMAGDSGESDPILIKTPDEWLSMVFQV